MILDPYFLTPIFSYSFWQLATRTWQKNEQFSQNKVYY